jgi:hypothetical protein
VVVDGEKMSDHHEPIPFIEGERVRVNLINDTMMGHPIHIHGHFFELVTGHGDHAPRKHTVIVQPGGKVSWDFTADAVGDWAFHCHLLYHMHAGMMRVVSVRPKETRNDPHPHAAGERDRPSRRRAFARRIIRCTTCPAWRRRRQGAAGARKRRTRPPRRAPSPLPGRALEASAGHHAGNGPFAAPDHSRGASKCGRSAAIHVSRNAGDAGHGPLPASGRRDARHARDGPCAA